MATQAQLSLDAYLHTSYRPDQEYIDGELRERNVGKWEHARLQALLAIWFGSHEEEWGVLVSTELRTQVSPSRVRIPDLVVLRTSPRTAVLKEAPLLAVEVLSPDDRYSDLEERARDYQCMGIETLWFIDPSTRTGRMCLGSNWMAVDRLEVPGTPIYLSLPALFAKLGPAPAEQ